jgi:hypothetical protein
MLCSELFRETKLQTCQDLENFVLACEQWTTPNNFAIFHPFWNDFNIVFFFILAKITDQSKVINKYNKCWELFIRTFSSFFWFEFVSRSNKK